MEEDFEHRTLFYDEDNKRISNFWAVPSFSEVCAIENQLGVFSGLNHSDLYQFDLGEPGNVDEYGRSILSEFTENN